jgi:hypothetical protein
MASNSLKAKRKFGGRDRDRTGDPLLAKQVLSQLSYTPIRATIILSYTYSHFLNGSNFEFRSIRSEDGFFGREFEAGKFSHGATLSRWQ